MKSSNVRPLSSALLFEVSGKDNDLYFFSGRDDVRRCGRCRHLLDKWNEPMQGVAPKRILDASHSYDGGLIVSARFKNIVEHEKLSGLDFVEVARDLYSPRSAKIVAFDSEARETRFENRCDTCGNWESIVGAYPIRLKETEIGPRSFARTDLEFGSGDEKSPMIICDAATANVLRAAGLRGLELDPVE